MSLCVSSTHILYVASSSGCFTSSSMGESKVAAALKDCLGSSVLENYSVALEWSTGHHGSRTTGESAGRVTEGRVTADSDALIASHQPPATPHSAGVPTLRPDDIPFIVDLASTAPADAVLLDLSKEGVEAQEGIGRVEEASAFGTANSTGRADSSQKEKTALASAGPTLSLSQAHAADCVTLEGMDALRSASNGASLIQQPTSKPQPPVCSEISSGKSKRSSAPSGAKIPPLPKQQQQDQQSLVVGSTLEPLHGLPTADPPSLTSAVSPMHKAGAAALSHMSSLSSLGRRSVKGTLRDVFLYTSRNLLRVYPASWKVDSRCG